MTTAAPGIPFGSKLGQLAAADPDGVAAIVVTNDGSDRELTWSALEAGAKHAAEHLTKRDPYRVERMSKTTGQILVEGNAAAAMGCMFAGVTVVAWYPITPSSSLPETLISYMRKYRMDKDTGKATFAIVQAEDEIAALGMVVGATWAGARAMTSTSGPGISLMSEFAGLAYYAEVPGVVFDIQRVGPSTGLPTRTAQGDILSTALLSHGDTKQIMIIPASVEECYTMSMEAFDLAERFQCLVFVMSDLDLAMNTWMSRTFAYPERPVDRGKVLDAAYWTDVVHSIAPDPETDDFYSSVMPEPVPAGTIVVRAEVAIGPGGPPADPDLDGDLPCSAKLRVGAGETARVEVRLDAARHCLSLLPAVGG